MFAAAAHFWPLHGALDAIRRHRSPLAKTCLPPNSGNQAAKAAIEARLSKALLAGCKYRDIGEGVMNRSLLFTLALLAVLSAGLGWRGVPATAATADVGYRDFRFGALCNSTPTGEKPESKLWWNDGFWWGSLCSSTDSSYHIFRLDLATQTWVDTGTQLDDRPSSKADTLWDGQKLYVASHIFSASGAPSSNPSQWGRLYRYSYDPAAKSYSLDRGFPVHVTRGRSETLVVEKAVNGQLWITYVEDRKVMVNHSIGGDTAWATPFGLPANGSTNLASDDICAIISFDRASATPRIGISGATRTTKESTSRPTSTARPQTPGTASAYPCPAAAAHPRPTIISISSSRAMAKASTQCRKPPIAGRPNR
jgi:hypothetical protein